MGRKAQIVALIDPEIRTQIDAARIMTRESRARVIEDMLVGALRVLDESSSYRRDVKRIEKLAKTAGVSYTEYVTAYAAQYARETYGPGLEALESGEVKIRFPAKTDSAAA